MCAERMTQRAAWMSTGSFGLMVHWLFPTTAPELRKPCTSLDEAVDAFDLDRFIDQFVESGADWLVFTLGQNTGYYASPNAIIEQLAGPGHCSQRNLALELATRVSKLGKRFIAYFPAEFAFQSQEMQAAFEWSKNDPAQVHFQRHYCRVIEEYARTFGSLLSGWMFDGCYSWDTFADFPFPSHLRDWPAWAKAARAGNPDAALAFNDASFCMGLTQPLTNEQDFLFGEIEVLREGKIRLGRADNAPLYLPDSRFAPGTRCQWHALPFIDAYWMHSQGGPMEPLLYSDEDLFSFVRACKAVGGAITLNAGIYQEGHLADLTLAQLSRLARSISAH